MDRTFRCIRTSESAAHWFKDTVRMRLDNLYELQKDSRQRSAKMLRLGKWPSMENPHPMRRSRLAEKLALVEPDVPAFKWGTAMMRYAQTRLEEDSGNTVLYKVLSHGQWIAFANKGRQYGTPTPGDARIDKLIDFPPTNLGAYRCLSYFTPDLEVAEKYAAYRKRRAGGDVAHYPVIVRMCIKTDVITSSMPGFQYDFEFPSPTWKEMVWHQMTRTGRLKFPLPLRKYVDSPLLRMTMPKGSRHVFEALSSGSDVGKEHVMPLPGNNKKPATQYVFACTDDVLWFLEGHAKFQGFAFTTASLC